MSSVVMIFDSLLRLASGSLLLLVVASATVLLTRQPARRVRVIQCALAGLVVLPCLLLVPGYPRFAVLPVFSPSPLAVQDQREVADRPMLQRADVAPDRFVPKTEKPPATAPVATPNIPTTISEPTNDAAIVTLPADASQIALGVPESRPRDDEDDSATSSADGPTLITAPAATGESPIAEATVQIAPQDAALPHDHPLPMENELAGEPIVRTTAALADYRLWIVAAYALGVLLMALWSLLGLAAVGRLLRSAKPAPEECRKLLRSLSGAESDRVSLVVSARVEQPCALLWRRTTIVLPEALVDQGDRQALRWALAHEWSHVERHDLATWTASAVIRWFYFYQPLVWWLRGQLQLSQDYLADTAAARAGETPEDYAEFLTTSSFTRPTMAAGLGIGGRISDLRRRVVMLVNPRRPLESKTPQRWNLAALPIAALVVLIAGGLAQQEDRLEAADRKPEAAKQEAPAASLVVATEEPATAPPLEPAPQPAPAPTPRPAPIPERAPVAVKASPRPEERPIEKGPRKIAPGDVLSVDVQDNLGSLSPAGVPFGIQLLLRSGATVSVDEEGSVSLGSAYGSISVGGKTLHQAESRIAVSLLDHTMRRLKTSLLARAGNESRDEDVRAALDQFRGLIQINVLLGFADNDSITAAAVSKRRGTVRPVEPSPPAPFETRPSKRQKQPVPTLAPSVPKSYASHTRVQHERIQPGDVLRIEAEPPEAQLDRESTVEADGNLALGVRFGRVQVAGKTLTEAEEVIKKRVAEMYNSAAVQLTFAERDPAAQRARVGVSSSQRLEQLLRQGESGYTAQPPTNSAEIQALQLQVQQLTEQIETLQKAVDKADGEKRDSTGGEPKPTIEETPAGLR